MLYTILIHNGCLLHGCVRNGNTNSTGNDDDNYYCHLFTCLLNVGSILHEVDPLSYFLFRSVLHDYCDKGRGMYYPVCGMMYIKEPLLLIGKSSPCGGSGFPLSLSGPLPYV